MSTRLWVPFAACLLALSACSDLSTAPGPVPQVDQVGGLRLSGSSDIDPPKNWPVRINSVVAAANLPGGNLPLGSSFGNVIGSMNYNAYHARITAQANLREGESAETRTFFPKERHSMGFSNQVHRAEWQIHVRAQCGAVLQADLLYEAWWRGLGGGAMELILETANESRQAFDEQEECECDEGTELQNNAFDSGYDPYSDGGGTTHCGGPGDGGEEGGTQYSPGDFTGGETVNWGTGIGNGGESVCGQAAQVDYVCIERYNDLTEEWEEWDCGYATVC